MDRRRPNVLAHDLIVAGRLVGKSDVATSRNRFLTLCRFLFIVVAAIGATESALASISYRQGTFNSYAGALNTVQVAYPQAQSAGDLNVVIVGWYDDTTSVVSVTDSRGNNYVRAIGPTVSVGNATQSIYYAKNIAAASAGANTVTVTFSADTYPDVRIAEYGGIDTANPFDGASAAAGDGASMDSGALTTTAPGDLLVAGNVVASGVIAAGPNFSIRMMTDSLEVLEDGIAATAGPYSGSSEQDTGGTGEYFWVMQLVAFKAASNNNSSVPLSPPRWNFVSAWGSNLAYLNWISGTSAVGITYLLERCQREGCTNFVQIAALRTADYYDSNSLAPASTYNYRMRVTDGTSFSNYSDVATIVTNPPDDTEPPTAPTGLSANGISGRQLTLTWNASTDNVGVSWYRIERCRGDNCSNFAQIATSYDTSYQDTNLDPATSYTYRVRAEDVYSNLGDYSVPFTVTTLFGGSLTYTYTYDALGRIAHVAVSDGSSIDYQYDADGNMTRINRQ